MEKSILQATKKTLGIDPSYTVFDHDIITHINSAFFTLSQLGVGPDSGFRIDDDSTEWDDFFVDEQIASAVPTYIYLKVRLLFDPPATSYLLAAYEKQIQEHEVRLSMQREEEEWADPDPPRRLEGAYYDEL